MPTPRPFPVDAKLTGIALAYKNDTYIADAVMPRVQVPSSTFRYRAFDKEAYLTVPNTMVGRKSLPNQTELGFKELPSFVVDYGLDDIIPNDDILNAPDNYNPQFEAVEYLAELMLIDRERRVADTVFNAGNYANGCKVTLNGNDQFSDPNSDPMAVMLDSLEVPFQRPNTIVMGREVWNHLCRHSKIVQTVYPNANGNGVITTAQLAQILDVDRILIGTARVNTAKRGSSAVNRCWGKHMAMLYIDPAASTTHRLTWGLTAEFGSRISGSMPEPEIGLRGSVRVRVGESVRELVLAPDAGYFIQNVVA